jgi:outer membrane protein
MNIKYKLFLFLWALSGIAAAQEKISLNQAITTALENNFEIRIIKQKARIADNNLHPGNAGMLPSLQARTNNAQANNTSNLEFATGKVQNTRNNISINTNASVNLDWTIFDGFAMFISYEKLKTLKDRSDVEVQMLLENTIKNVIFNYYELLKLSQDMHALRNNLQISEERLEKLEIKAIFGAALKHEILKARVDMNRDSTALLQTVAAFNNTARNLAYLMGLSADTVLVPLPQEVLFELYSMEYFLHAAHEKNTALNKFLIDQSLSELDYRLIRASRFPRVSINSAYAYAKSSSDVGVLLSNENYGISYGLTASFDLFQGFRKNIESRNARINIEISELLIMDIKRELQTSIYNNYELYLNNITILQMEQQNSESAELNYRRASELYDLGRISSVELREAQLNLLKSKYAINEAFFRVKVALSELKLLGGLLLEDSH